jgi:uncharacterized protein YkwD
VIEWFNRLMLKKGIYLEPSVYAHRATPDCVNLKTKMKTIWESSWGAKLMGIGRIALVATYLTSFAMVIPPVQAQTDSPAPEPAPAVEVVSSNISTSQIVSSTNQMRLAVGQSSLAVNAKLAQSAQLKAKDMAVKSYFAHENPEGQRLAYWLGVVGYAYKFAGENLAVGFNSAEAAMEGWKNSPGHYSNIIKPEYQEIGVGTASGIYKGRPVVFVVQHFGVTKNLVIPVAENVEITVKPVFAQEPVTKNQVPSTNSQEPIAVSTADESMQKASVQLDALSKSLPVSLNAALVPMAYASTTDNNVQTSQADADSAISRYLMLGIISMMWLLIGAILYVEMATDGRWWADVLRELKA